MMRRMSSAQLRDWIAFYLLEEQQRQQQSLEADVDSKMSARLGRI